MNDRTEVEVRVIAAGGKFLGDDVGGARVAILDALTGEVLAQGTARGGSGDVKEIMAAPRTWGQPIPVDGASVFHASLELAEPRRVEVLAYGPLGALQSAREVRTTRWLVPGERLVGEHGVLMVIPGLVVQTLSPATHQPFSTLPQRFDVLANVAMMCGCPITDSPQTPYWPPRDFEVEARVSILGTVKDPGREPRLVETVKLAYAGTASRFGGSFVATEEAYYAVTVVARQKRSGNEGVDRVTVFYSPPA